MLCHCGKIALTHVRGRGFCKQHRAESVAATAKELKREQSEIAISRYQRDLDGTLLTSREVRATESGYKGQTPGYGHLLGPMGGGR